MRPILIVSYHFDPENVPSVLRVRWFRKHLPAFGYQPEILAASRTLWLRAAVPDEPENGVHRTPAAGWMRKCLHYGNLAANLVSMYTRIGDYGLAWLPFGIRKARRIVKERSIAAVVTTQPSVVSALVGLHLKKAFGLAWLADFQDPLAGNPCHDRHPLGDRWQRWAERQIFRHADCLIANTDSVAAMWTKSYPEHAHKIRVIWNGYDEEEPVPPARPLQRGYRVLAHIGTIYAARQPSVLLDAYERLVAADKLDPETFKLRFVGSFDWSALPNPEQVRRMEEKGWLELVNVYIPRQEALREAAESDYLLVLDMNEANSDLQVPCKIYDSLRTGRPILAVTPVGSPVERILRHSGVEHQIVPNQTASPEQVESALLQLARTSPDPRPTLSWFEETHEARALSAILAGELNRVLAG